MNSLPRKNYALNRVSHLTKSSHAIAIQAITANLSRIRHSYSTVSSIDLQSLNLSQIFTTYLNLMARAPLRSNLLAHGTSCISPGGSSSASSYFTKPINFIAAAGYGSATHQHCQRGHVCYQDSCCRFQRFFKSSVLIPRITFFVVKFNFHKSQKI